MAKHVMESLIKNGSISRGYLAVVPQDITEDLAKALNLNETSGALIGDVTKDGPADKAGMKRGDIIKSFNGIEVDNSAQLRNIVSDTEPGTEVPLIVQRKNEKIELNVTLGTRPNNASAQQSNSTDELASSEKLGLTVQNLTPEVAKHFGFDGKNGVVITEIEVGSPAESAGLKSGDIIREVNQTAVNSTEDFENIISNITKGDTVALLVARGKFTFYVAIEI
jgi:serine protease Do